MEVCALIISIIAIVISFLELYYNYRSNKTNIKLEYFSALYNEYLFVLIPCARKKIEIIGGRFVGFEELQKVLMDMILDSAFFEFTDKVFYSQLKDSCMKLEDYLLDTANKKGIQISTPCDEVDNKLTEIYKIITTKREKG